MKPKQSHANLENGIVDQIYRMPYEIVTHWIHILQKQENYAHYSAKQKQVIKDMLNDYKERWMAHELTIDSIKIMLTEDSKTLHKVGLNDLADKAFSANQQNSLYSQLPPSSNLEYNATRLNDNVYGRKFENEFIKYTINHTPKNVLDAMTKAAEGLQSLVRDDPNFISSLQNFVRGDYRPWFENQPKIKFFVNAESPHEAYKSLSDILSTPVADSSSSMLVGYLGQKIFKTVSTTSQAQAHWFTSGQKVYDVIEHIKKTGLFKNDPPSKSKVKNPQTQDFLNEKAVKTFEPGINFSYQNTHDIPIYKEVFSSEIPGKPIIIPDRPVQTHLLNTPFSSGDTPTFLGETPKLFLEHGVPSSAGVSGTTNIWMTLLSHFKNDLKIDLNVKDAFIGVMQFLNYDGGHSINEILWTAHLRENIDKIILDPTATDTSSQYLEAHVNALRKEDPARLKIGLDGFTSKISPNDPIKFVADYESLISSYEENSPVRKLLQDAKEYAFNKVNEHFQKHSRYADSDTHMVHEDVAISTKGILFNALKNGKDPDPSKSSLKTYEQISNADETDTFEPDDGVRESKTNAVSDFEILCTIKPVADSPDSAKIGNYNKLKKHVIQKFNKFPENERKVLFNDSELKIELGYTYSDFYSLIIKKMEREVLPDPYGKKFNKQDIKNENIFLLQEEGKKFDVVRTVPEHILNNNKLMGYDLGHPLFNQSVQNSQKNIFSKDSISLPKDLKKEDLIKQLISQNNDNPLRLVLGESHNNATARKMLIEAMPLLKKQGSTLFLEACFYQNQKIVDDWLNAPKDAPLPLVLARDSNSMIDVYKAAKENGVRFIGIDTESVRMNAYNSSRTENMNYIAQKIINNFSENKSFVALVGAAHAGDTIKPYVGNKIFGLGSILKNTTSVVVLDFPSDSEVYTGKNIGVLVLENNQPIESYISDVSVRADIKDKLKESPLYFEIHESNHVKSSSPKDSINGNLFKKLENGNEVLIEQENLIGKPSSRNNSSEEEGESLSFEREPQPIEPNFSRSYSLDTHFTSSHSVETSFGGLPPVEPNVGVGVRPVEPNFLNSHTIGTGVNVGMTLLGLGGVYSALRKGDTVNAAIGSGQTALGATGISVEIGLKTGLLKMTSTAVKSFTKAIPFVGAAFCAYAAVEDGVQIYKAAKNGDVLGIIKGSMGMALDVAMGVAGFIPGVGTAAMVALAAVRMLSDSIIDQASDPYAYQKTFLVMHDKNSWWLEKGMAAVTGGAQYFFQGIIDVLNPSIKEFRSKQQREFLEKLQYPDRNLKEFFEISDKDDVCVLDFNAPSLAHHAGSLTVDLESKSKLTISFNSAVIDGKDYALKTSLTDFNPRDTSTFHVIMGQGGTYQYTWKKHHEYINSSHDSIVDQLNRKLLIPSNTDDAIDTLDTIELINKTLTSTYSGPQDGTNVVFVAPSNPKLGDPKFPLVENRSTLGSGEISYKIIGGTGKNVYFLGHQQTEITCGTGINEVHIPANSENDHHINLIGFRDDGTCSLVLEHISDKQFIDFTTIENGKDHLLLKNGNLMVELPNTMKKIFINTSDDGGRFIFNLDSLNSDQTLLKDYAVTASIQPEFTKNHQCELDWLHKIGATSVKETFIIDGNSPGIIQIKDFDLANDTIKINNLSKDVFLKILNKKLSFHMIDESPWINDLSGNDGTVTVEFKELKFHLTYNFIPYMEAKFPEKILKIDTGAGYFDVSFEKKNNTQTIGHSIQSDLSIKSVTFTPRTVVCTHGRNDNLLIKASDSGKLVVTKFDSEQDTLKLLGFSLDMLKSSKLKTTESNLLTFTFGNVDVELYPTKMEFLTIETESGSYNFNMLALLSGSSTQNLWDGVVSSVQWVSHIKEKKTDSLFEATKGSDLFVFTEPTQATIKNFDYNKDRLKISGLSTHWFEKAQIGFRKSPSPGGLDKIIDLQLEVGNFTLESNSLKMLTVQTDDGVFKVDVEAYAKDHPRIIRHGVYEERALKNYIVFATMGMQDFQSSDTGPFTRIATPGYNVFMVNAEQKKTTAIEGFGCGKDQLKIVKTTDRSIADARITFNKETSTLQITCDKAVINLKGIPENAQILHITIGNTLLEMDVASLKAAQLNQPAELNSYILSATHGLINHDMDHAMAVAYVGTDGSDTFLANTQQKETLQISNFDFKKDKLLVSNLERTWFKNSETEITYNAAQKTFLIAFGTNKTKVQIALTDKVIENPLVIDSDEGSFALNISQFIIDAIAGTPKPLKNYIVNSLQRSKFFKSPETSEIEIFESTGGGDEFVLNAHHQGSRILNFDGEKDSIQILNLESMWWLKAQILKNHTGLNLKIGASEIQIESQNIGSRFVLKANDGVFEIDTSTLTDIYKPLTVTSTKMGYKNFMIAEGSKIASNDNFTGTQGEDTMIINSKHAGKTVIKGFEGRKDKIYLVKSSELGEQLTYEDIFRKSQDVGNNVVITFDPDNEVIIEDFQKSHLTANHFFWNIEDPLPSVA